MAHLGVKIKFKQIFFLWCTKPTLWEEALHSSKESWEDLPTFKEYVRACAHWVHKTNLPVRISSQAIRKMFMYFLGSTHITHMTLYMLYWSRCKAGNHTEQVLATTSCKMVETLCIKIVFPNSVHHQGRTLASARDFPLSSFHSISWNCYHFQLITGEEAGIMWSLFYQNFLV